MEQHSGKKYKCINSYYGLHNGIYGRSADIYKVIEKDKLKEFENRRYLFRKVLNEYFYSMKKNKAYAYQRSLNSNRHVSYKNFTFIAEEPFFSKWRTFSNLYIYGQKDN